MTPPMKLVFLGSGSAFTIDNYHSNMVLESAKGKRLLIDCGSDVRHSSQELNYQSSDFDAVYISHFHADHVGGLEWLAFSTKFNPKATKPKLIIHPSMVDYLWEHVLSGGLQSLKDEQCSIHTYFDLYSIHPDDSFDWEGASFKMVKTIHIYHNQQLMPSYGLFITQGNKNIFITTDSSFSPETYKNYYQEADIIFHDCYTGKDKNCVHADFASLTTLPLEIKNKMWLYHYSDEYLPDAKAQGFLGLVKKGQVFLLQ